MDAATAELGRRLHDLMKAVRLVKQRQSFHRPGVPVALLGMLAEVDRLSSGCHARELAAQAALDPSTVSRAVAGLVSSGLVAREPDERDGRASVLVVTPAGRAALDETVSWYGEIFDRALDGWTAEEIASFSRALERFAGSLISLESSDESTHGSMEAAR